MGTAVHPGTRRGTTRVDQEPLAGPDAFPGGAPAFQGRQYHSPEHTRAGGEGLASFLGWFSIGLGVAQLVSPGAVARLCGIEPSGRNRSLMRALGLRELTSGVGILSNPKPAGWMWSRVVGDAMDVALLTSALSSSDNDRARTAFATAAVLGVGALDFLTSNKLSRQPDATRGLVLKNEPIRVRKSVTILRSAEDLYSFWRNFENFPRFMRHLESVQVIDERRSHWKAKAPAGMSVEWDAIIVEDEPNARIAWRSVEGADVTNSGVVRFAPAPGDRGTEITVDLQYEPPAGRMSALFAKLFREEPGQQVKDDLRRFKQVVETGDIVLSDATAHAGRGPHPAQPPARRAREGA